MKNCALSLILPTPEQNQTKLLVNCRCAEGLKDLFGSKGDPDQCGPAGWVPTHKAKGHHPIPGQRTCLGHGLVPGQGV